MAGLHSSTSNNSLKRRRSETNLASELGHKKLKYDGPETTQVCHCCEKPADQVCRCQRAHLVCQQCMELALKDTMLWNQAAVYCPVILCYGEIPRGELSRLGRSTTGDLVINRKQHNSSVAPVDEPSGMFSCPLCNQSAQMDDTETIFYCLNGKCNMTCCRYCRVSLDVDFDLFGQPALTRELLKQHAKCRLLQMGDPCFPLDLAEVPAHWAAYDISEYKGVGSILVPLSPGTTEFTEVANLYRESTPSDIVKIFRVQNPKVWQRFLMKRRMMLEENGSDQLNEQFLFQGSSTEQVERVCRRGFDFQKPPGLLEQIVARGRDRSSDLLEDSYLAEVNSEDKNSNMVLMVRVCRGADNLLLKNWLLNSLFDPQPAFSNEQCYPAYLVEFSR